MVAPELTSKVPYAMYNIAPTDQNGLNAEDSKSLSVKLRAAIADGTADEHEINFNDDECDAPGFVRNGGAARLLSSFREKTGKDFKLDKKPMLECDRELLVEFCDFLDACGGFNIG